MGSNRHIGPPFPPAGGRARTGSAGRLWRDCSDCVGGGRGGGGGLNGRKAGPVPVPVQPVVTGPV